MIEGVIIKTLKTHEDDRGFFREIFRFSEEFNDVPVGQLSHSEVKGGVVKGWHGHKEQSQWNYVITGVIQVALYDNRAHSVTYDETMKLLVGDTQEPKAYFFPPGVLHGYKCLKGPLNIIYVTSGSYDMQDEERIDINRIQVNFNDERL